MMSGRVYSLFLLGAIMAGLGLTWAIAEAQATRDAVHVPSESLQQAIARATAAEDTVVRLRAQLAAERPVTTGAVSDLFRQICQVQTGVVP